MTIVIHEIRISETMMGLFMLKGKTVSFSIVNGISSHFGNN